MALKKFRIGFIGAGKMGEALIKSLLKEISPAEICFFEKDAKRAEELGKSLQIMLLNSNEEVYRQAQFVFVCVKPDQVKDVLEELKSTETDAVLVSIAAGVSTDYFRSFGKLKVIRAMPNTPALVGRGITAVAESPYVSKSEFEEVVGFFKIAGEVVVVKENQMNAVTALSGSGPAYVFLFLEALKEAGINVGLPANVSELLAVETLIGACELFKQSQRSTSELIEMVASPGGTTIAGLKSLEKNAFKYAVMEAVESACKRAYELEKSGD